MLVRVSHHGLFGMLRSVNYVTPCSVGVVCRLFVLSRVMMFGGLPVMAGGVRQVLRRLFVMLGGFLRHGIFLIFRGRTSVCRKMK